MWSWYDTMILLSGIILVVAALLPLPGMTPKNRLLFGVAGGGLVILSFILGSLSSFRYPSALVIAPVISIAVVVGTVVAANRSARSAAHLNEQVSRLQSSEGSAVAEQPQPADAAPVVAGVESPPVLVTPTPVDVDSAAEAPAAVHDTAAGEAGDPDVDPVRLQEIAATSPDLHPIIAANPAAYPDLLAWLALVGDPATRQVLAERAHRESGLA